MTAPRGARAEPPRSGVSADDVERARTLDQQGVRAFREGRYNDAIRYFAEAYKLGGPSSELWNIARCDVKLDDPESASVMLERYLACSDLSAEDRASALRELDELHRRPSTVTIASSPEGAFVFVDGRRVGRTPASTDVTAGEHVVVVQREGYSPYTDRVVARFGRAIIVHARMTDSSRDGSAPPNAGGGRRHWFTASAEGYGLFARLGSIGRPLHPAALVSLGYVALERRSIDVVTGARFVATYDSWDAGTVGPPATACGPESATALGFFADAAFGYRPLPRLRIGGDVGFGFASETGKDDSMATCDPPTGLAPAGHFGADISYAVLSTLRIVFSPILLEIQPALGGAPVDASGPWIRIGSGLGLAVDL